MGTDWARDCHIIYDNTLFIQTVNTKYLDRSTPVHHQRLLSLASLYCTICPEGPVSITQDFHSFPPLPFNSTNDASVFNNQRSHQLPLRDCDCIHLAV